MPPTTSSKQSSSRSVGAARVEIADRLAEAERFDWPETTATLLFALAVDAITSLPDQAAAAIDTLIETR